MPRPRSKTPHPPSQGPDAPSREFTSGSVEDTHAFGEQLGRVLRAGDVVALHGELGSGKTTLVQGLARGVGLSSESIKSPTFVLMREYPGPPALVHLDGYRLEGPPAAAWLDLDLLFSPRKITVIEWAERLTGLLPEDHLAVRCGHVSAHRRRISVSATGPRSAAILSALPQADASGRWRSAPSTPLGTGGPGGSTTEGPDASPRH